MTRETDSSSSGPQGGGGAAYPSGTPPYGARPFPSLHPQERQRPAGAPEPGPAPEAAEEPSDEPKTETTLTTRIRINIPGSRPIPPVVVRTPVDENTAAQAVAAQAALEEPAAQAAPEEAEAEPEGGKKTSDWFAPRRSAPGQGQPGGTLGGQGTGAADPGTGQGPAAGPGPGAGNGPGTGSGSASGSPSGSFPGAPSGGSGGTLGGGFRMPGEGLPGGPPAPQGGPPPADFFPPAPPQGDDLFAGPYAEPFNDPDTGSHPAPGGFLPPPVGLPPEGSPPGAGPAGRGPHETPPAGFRSPFDTSGGTGFRTEPAPFGTEDFPPGVPRPIAEPYDPAAGPHPGPPIDDDPFGVFGRPPAQPAGPTSGPATGDMPLPPLGEGGFRPSTEEFARPGSEYPDRSEPPGARLPGDTLVGGIPPIPPGEVRGPLSPAGPPPRPVPAPAPAPAPQRVPPPAAKSRAGKGRSKLVMAGVLVAVVAVLAYGAGLMMNHADVPKGTTVLGVDIGNMNQDAAVKTLDKALGDRTTAALDLTVGGKKQTLMPSIAGLSVDTDATVRKVAHSDYNPVSVIGSLFGGSRKADPVIVVDHDKLTAALRSLAGKDSAGSDGMVRFADGKAIAVPGRPSQSIDVGAAADQVAAAYRNRAETGADQPVALKVTTVPPKVTQADLDKAVNGFGRTAMSGPATVTAGGLHSVPFNKSLPQFLTMMPAPDGTLAPHIDLKVLKSLYGTAYDGVLLQRGDGSKTAVTPQDIATALVQALGRTNPADRVVMLPNVVS